MKKRIMALMMTGVLSASVGFGSFADTVSGTTGIDENLLNGLNSTTSTSTTTTPATTNDLSQFFNEMKDATQKSTLTKAQINQIVQKILQAKKQYEVAQKNLSKNKSNKKYKDEAAKLEALIASLNGQVKEKQNDLKEIEAILKTSDTSIVVIEPAQIASDNPNYKANLPLVVKNNVVYCPTTAITSLFNGTVKYDSKDKKVILKVNGTLVEMYLLQKEVEIDGISQDTTNVPMAYDGKVYVPMLQLQTVLNMKVSYSAETKMVTIDDLGIQN